MDTGRTCDCTNIWKDRFTDWWSAAREWWQHFKGSGLGWQQVHSPDSLFVGEEILALNISSGNRAALYSAQAKTRDCSTLVDEPCWKVEVRTSAFGWEVISVNSPLGNWTVMNTHKHSVGNVTGTGNEELDGNWRGVWSSQVLLVLC